MSRSPTPAVTHSQTGSVAAPAASREKAVLGSRLSQTGTSCALAPAPSLLQGLLAGDSQGGRRESNRKAQTLS